MRNLIFDVRLLWTILIVAVIVILVNWFSGETVREQSTKSVDAKRLEVEYANYRLNRKIYEESRYK